MSLNSFNTISASYILCNLDFLFLFYFLYSSVCSDGLVWLIHRDYSVIPTFLKNLVSWPDFLKIYLKWPTIIIDTRLKWLHETFENLHTRWPIETFSRSFSGFKMNPSIFDSGEGGTIKMLSSTTWLPPLERQLPLNFEQERELIIYLS